MTLRVWMTRLATAVVLALVPLRAGRALARERLEVASIPIMPMAQLFVMEGEGWTEAAGLELELTKFSSGPAMVARANGVPIKVVASNVVEQIALIARGRFAEVVRASEIGTLREPVPLDALFEPRFFEAAAAAS